MLRPYLPVFRVIGMLLLALAATMTIPLAVDLAGQRRDLPALEVALILSLFTGLALVVSTKVPGPFELDQRQAFLCTGAAWLVLPAMAAIPFMGVGLSPVDAWFESVSAMTTTGSTVFNGLDDLPRGVLFWRSFLQWLGGVGIIVMAVSMLPFMRVAGMQLFRTESSDRSDKILGNPIDFVRGVVLVYAALTVLCAVAYETFGMSGFDAINHAMTTVSTGGFSTHDASFGAFPSFALQWTAVIFMMAGALPFVAYIKVLSLTRRPVVSDTQVAGFVLFLIGASLILAAWLSVSRGDPFGEALTASAFNVVSIVTTTGYASADYSAWGAPAIGAFFLLTFVGGCSGSTAGGIKIYRLQIVGILIAVHLRRLLSPARIAPIRYNGQAVEDEVLVSILVFLILFLATLAVGTLTLACLGLDIVTAVTASLTAVANVGPGLGSIVGPAGNFGVLPDAAKLVLSVAMIAGRLEFIALLVMFTPAFWRW